MENLNLQFRMDPATYKKLENFCRANGMEPNEYLNKLVKEKLDLAMYGDLNEKMKQKEEAVDITPESVKPVDCTPVDITPEVIASVQDEPKVEEEKQEEPVEEKPKKTRREVKVK